MWNHSTVLTALVADLLAIVAGSYVLYAAVRVVTSWSPTETSAEQLRLERLAEGVRLWSRLFTSAFVIATLVLVFVVADRLVDVVPGAMCGTGVFRAMGGDGQRALWFRLLAALGVAVYSSLMRASGFSRTGQGILKAMRAYLLAAPLVLLAVWTSYQAIGAIDSHRAVDCCSRVLLIARGATGVETKLNPETVEPWWFVAMSGLLFCQVVAISIRPAWTRGVKGGVLLALTLGWLWSAWVCLPFFVKYHYGVLAHRCVWCLFLGEHNFVGYPMLLTAWMVVSRAIHLRALGGACRFASRHGGAQEMLDAQHLEETLRKEALIIMASLVAFFLLTVGPACWWWWDRGVSIDGGGL